MSEYDEALQDLRKQFDLQQNLPYSPDWSAGPDFLKLIAEHCLTQAPVNIIECSSGLTTLILARCCQSNQQGKVFSLEDGEEYVARTTTSLEHHELSPYANVTHAPLEKITVGNEDYQWYESGKIPDLQIDMLVIDGPSGFIQRHSRYPALPLLYDRLADGCRVFLDDASRTDEREIVERWLEAYPSMGHEYIELERGCSVLTVNKL